MNVTKFKQLIQDIIEPLQFKVFLGPFTSFNVKREVYDRELIIEPLQYPLTRPGRCDYDLEVVFNIGIRRPVDTKYHNAQDDSVFIDKMIEEASDFFQLLKSSEKVTVKQNPENIKGVYFEADSSRSVNSQAFLRFTVPIKIHGVN